MDQIVVDTGYTPRPLQAHLHKQLKRFNVLVCHRRFGKTVFCLNEMIDRALRCTEQNPRYAYIAPLYKQAKSVAWDYLKLYTKAIPGVKYNESELRVDFPINGARIYLLGADNPDAVRGMYLDGAIMDEYAQMSPRMWGEVIRPMLSDRKGWAIFIGTPMGHNEFYEVYQFAKFGPKCKICTNRHWGDCPMAKRSQKIDEEQYQGGSWFACLYRASETGVIDEDELMEARAAMEENEYEQEFECSFTAAVRGAYYGRLLEEADHEKRIADVPYDPALPVSTGWDIGVGDDTVIWFFQQSGGWIHVIDYYANRGEGMAHYKKILDEKALKEGYSYATHYGPHDLEAKEWGTGKTRQEQASALGLDFEIVAQVKLKEDGINAVRAVLPRCRFDLERTAEGVEALRQYRREWDDKNRTFRDRPLHDWCSHPADGFQTLALGIKERYEPYLKKARDRYARKQRDYRSWMAN